MPGRLDLERLLPFQSLRCSPHNLVHQAGNVPSLGTPAFLSRFFFSSSAGFSSLEAKMSFLRILPPGVFDPLVRAAEKLGADTGYVQMAMMRI